MTVGPARVIDAHLHLWDIATGDYTWLTPDAGEIHRSYALEDALPYLDAHDVDQVVLVQAADADGDTERMLAAAEDDRVAGVVGFVPLHRPEQAATRLAELAQSRLLVGIRNLTHDRPDPDWMLRPDVHETLELLVQADLPLDLVTNGDPRQLRHAATVAEQHPGLRMVIDHLGKPPIKGGGPEASRPDAHDPDAWVESMTRAAAYDRVYAKVSGLYPVTGQPSHHRPEDLRFWIETAVELFGPERLMFGSDWPVSVTAGGYSYVWNNVMHELHRLGQDVTEQITGATARAFYRLDGR